jgi:hypothetical protein
MVSADAGERQQLVASQSQASCKVDRVVKGMLCTMVGPHLAVSTRATKFKA